MAVALKTPLVLATDDDLLRVSRDNPGYRFEREDDGTVIASPTHTKRGAKTGEAFGQLRDYRKLFGGKAFDSQAGFAIGPDKRIASPDASWVSHARIDALAGVDEGFWPLCPDVAIEVRSTTDSFKDTIAKVSLFVERGSIYAVAIDPSTREVVEVGVTPAGLTLDFDAIIDA